MSLSEKIINMDPRYSWMLLLFVIVIPILYPMGIPVPISIQSRIVKNRLDQLEAGNIVIWDMSGGLAVSGELEPGNTVVMRHLLSKGVKIILFSLIPDGPAFFKIVENLVKPEETFGARYGEDLVFLGYIAGLESGQVAMMKDILGTAPIDYYGNRIENLPIMENIRSVNDVDLLISTYTGAIPSRIRSYSATAGQRGDRAWVAITTAGNVVPIMPYVDSRDVYGVLGGSVPAAEYENMTGFLGNGVKRTDVLSISQLYILILILVTNIAYTVARIQGRVK